MTRARAGTLAGIITAAAIATSAAAIAAPVLVVPLDTVAYTERLEPVELASVPVPVELEGVTCTVGLVVENPGSPHVGNAVSATSAGGAVWLYHVEDERGPTTVAGSGELTLGAAVIITWHPTEIHTERLGRLVSVWSAGVYLDVGGCAPPETTTTTTTAAPPPDDDDETTTTTTTAAPPPDDETTTTAGDCITGHHDDEGRCVHAPTGAGDDLGELVAFAGALVGAGALIFAAEGLTRRRRRHESR